ncbi:E1b-55kD-associated protein, partial [Clonorchis sinensis]
MMGGPQAGLSSYGSSDPAKSVQGAQPPEQQPDGSSLYASGAARYGESRPGQSVQPTPPEQSRFDSKPPTQQPYSGYPPGSYPGSYGSGYGTGPSSGSSAAPQSTTQPSGLGGARPGRSRFDLGPGVGSQRLLRYLAEQQQFNLSSLANNNRHNNLPKVRNLMAMLTRLLDRNLTRVLVNNLLPVNSMPLIVMVMVAMGLILKLLSLKRAKTVKLPRHHPLHLYMHRLSRINLKLRPNHLPLNQQLIQQQQLLQPLMLRTMVIVVPHLERLRQH